MSLGYNEDNVEFWKAMGASFNRMAEEWAKKTGKSKYLFTISFKPSTAEELGFAGAAEIMKNAGAAAAKHFDDLLLEALEKHP